MTHILMFAFALTAGATKPYEERPRCEYNLEQPMADDVYERLGFEGPVPITDVTVRFRILARQYQDVPKSLQRFREAYNSIRTRAAQGKTFEKSRFPLATLERAHGPVDGNSVGGYFTSAYGINDEGLPTMDANVMTRNVLNTSPVRERLLEMNPATWHALERYVLYFVQNIRRVGVEGGFEDVIELGITWYRGSDANERAALKVAHKYFVEAFGETYVRAVCDRKGPGLLRLRQILGRGQLPPFPAPVAPEERLAGENDPRTALRHVVHQCRVHPRKMELLLAKLGWVYAHRFLIDEAQFIQHVLLFASDQWTGRQLRPEENTVDRRLVKALIDRLEGIWISEPVRTGRPERWLDFANVLWDAHFVTADQRADASLPRPDSPAWVRLQKIAEDRPEVLREVEAERAPRALPSEVMPWSTD